MPSPTTHSWRGLPGEDTITIAHIMDCPGVTVHAGKHYQALIDSGAAISLIRHSTYKQIEDCYKTPIQPMAAKHDQDPDSSSDSSSEYSDEEEDFQTVPIDNEHWTTEMVPERTFCIHENGLPNNVCQ